MKPLENECDLYHEELSVYLDGESERPGDVEAHLASCPQCRERLEAMRALGEKIKSLPEPVAPSALRADVKILCRTRSFNRAKRRWVAVGGVAATMVVILAVLLRDNARKPDVIPIYLDDHVSIVQAQTETGLVSSDPAELESWLAARLDFATPIPRWPWADYAAARVCSLRGTRISLVRLHADDRELSLFVHPPLDPSVSSGGTPENPKVIESKGYETACWTEGGLEYVLVASAPAGDLIARIGER